MSERMVIYVPAPLAEELRARALRGRRSLSAQASMLMEEGLGRAAAGALASGGVDAPAVADPSPEEAVSAPPVASGHVKRAAELAEGPLTTGADLLAAIREGKIHLDSPAEAGVTPGEPSGQAEDAGAVDDLRAPAPQGNDLSTWGGPDQRSAKFRKLGK